MTWLVVAADNDGVTVEARGEDPEVLAGMFARAAAQEIEQWPQFGLVYMLVEGEEVVGFDFDEDLPG